MRRRQSGLEEGANALPSPALEVAVMPDPVAVPTDQHDVAVVQHPVNQSRRHHLIAGDPVPLADVPSALEAPLLVSIFQPLVPTRNQLEEERGPAWTHR